MENIQEGDNVLCTVQKIEGTTVFVKVENIGHEDLEDLRIIAMIDELALRQSTGKFDLDEEDSFGRFIYLEIPEDAESGLYLIKVAVQNDDYRDSAYRQVWIR